MKSIIYCILFSSCLFISCTNRQQRTDIRDNQQIDSLQEDSIETNSVEDIDYLHQQDTDSTLYSALRPKEQLHKNIIYTDTVKFISYDVYGDYMGITVSKNNKEDYLLVNKEDSTLRNGDSLIIKWQVIINSSLDNPDDKWLCTELIQKTLK